ncbi:hopanoid biosynthesis-associated protein HpnK [Stenomitos frigidus]|uniref:Hopanoid biosynthesis associated protein HpnK n=1 Tax=Stenomitos frigidus ULC18 TaxID=2107698 RepID=A0A2T1E9R3_9CYAN|nr:hopanoid biosynthesis-associated protein HpnK [Stenomitos frigidus]PSB29444.1 hopanoid biosynthesis associated protein HpnK [Stenomitos frigidus ULC18]
MHQSGHPSSRRQLIVNGDDFGFSSGVNQAIIAAHERGVLTSTSLMVTGDAFEEAVALAKAHSTLAVGLHLVLACGRSVLSPTQIPHLVDTQGSFSNQPEKAGLYYHFNAAARRELPLEIRAQLEKFRQTGLPLSHVDGHVHVHVQPVVLHHLVRLAKEFNIRFMRLPFEEASIAIQADRSEWITKRLLSFVYAGLRRYGKRVLRSQGIHSVDRVYGLLHSGRMTEAYLLKLIPLIQANLVEIYSHPATRVAGEPDNGIGLGQAERDALISDRVRIAIQHQGFELTNYCHLGVVRP